MNRRATCAYCGENIVLTNEDIENSKRNAEGRIMFKHVCSVKGKTYIAFDVRR